MDAAAARQLDHIEAVDIGESAHDPALLIGKTERVQGGAEALHHRFACAQELHREGAAHQLRCNGRGLATAG